VKGLTSCSLGGFCFEISCEHLLAELKGYFRTSELCDCVVFVLAHGEMVSMS
jgi:hypothetical protein